MPCLKGKKFEAHHTKVKYRGVFDLKDLYRNCTDVLKDKGFVDNKSYRYMETLYQEKISANPREGKAMWIWWRTDKSGDGSPYYTQHIDLTFHMRYLKEIEIMEQNRKIKVDSGEVEVEIEAYLCLDPEGKWEKHWLLSHVHETYYKRMWRKQRESILATIKSDAETVANFLKGALELKRFVPERPGFYPPRGYKGAME